HYDRCKRAGVVEGTTSAEALALGNLWMLHQDLLGYALLGDPAVRLPLASARAGEEEARRTPTDSTAKREPIPLSVGAGAARREPGGDRRGDVDASDVDRLERAAIAIAGGGSPGVVAAQLGVPRSEVSDAAEVYRAAGRAALAVLLRRRGANE